MSVTVRHNGAQLIMFTERGEEGGAGGCWGGGVREKHDSRVADVYPGVHLVEVLGG